MRSIGEMVGAIAVFVTLVYLAAQIAFFSWSRMQILTIENIFFQRELGLAMEAE
jgi:hypothetical protein